MGSSEPASLICPGRPDRRRFESADTIAIKRQLLPVLLNRYDEAVGKQRSEQLTKMLEVINQSGG